MKTILTRLGLSAPPFDAPVSLLVVADGEQEAEMISRWLGRKWAIIEVCHDRPSASLAVARTHYDAAIVDMDFPDVWGVVSDLRSGMPVLGIVRSESVGIKALMRGLDGVFNRLTLRGPELVGTLHRAICSRKTIDGGCAPCEAALDALGTATRTLARVGEAQARYAH